MTSVSDVRPASSHQLTQRTPGKPTPHDVRAMGDALANARRLMHGQQTVTPPGGKGSELKGTAGKTTRGDAREPLLGADGAPDRLSDPIERSREEGDSGGQGNQDLAQGPSFAPQAVATLPSPTADPSAFAQALADLWTRENGKGAKEVSVRFGRSAWPATGARLVRNASGTLDITLQLDPAGAAYDAALPGLEQELSAAGVGVGALVIEQA